MSGLNKVLPFTCIKLHFEGEIFAPVLVGNDWQLQSDAHLLVGSRGNPYQFKTEQNASVWIDSNLIKASKSQLTAQTYIDRLTVINSTSPHDYLSQEIAIVQARNAGEWGVYLTDEVFGDWGAYIKGDTGEQGAQGLKGDKGDTGAAGAQGAQGLQGVQGLKGDTGLQGAQGLNGDKGDTGAQGLQGVQGLKGDTGAQGASGITWQFPIGYILIDDTGTNPASFLGYGTWTQFGAGKVLVGIDPMQTEFDTLGETGGAKTHALTEAENGVHNHTQNAHTHIQNAHGHNNNLRGGSTGGGASEFNVSGFSGGLGSAQQSIGNAVAVNQNTTATNNPSGNGQPHNNLQPYIVVKFWKRTA